MSRFKEIAKYKQEILMKLISSENIVKAIVYEQENFLDQPSVENADELVYKSIHPYNKILDFSKDREVYITIDYDDYRLVNRAIKTGFIIFGIYVYADLMKTSYGMNRTDYILSEIDELFNNSKNFGIGNFTFNSMKQLPVNEKYMGLIVKYKVYDFN